MKLYFFGSEECETCQLMLSILDKSGIFNVNNLEFISIDAFSEEHQQFCDKHEIDEIPHIKLIDERDELVFERIGIFHPDLIKEIIFDDECEKNENSDEDFAYDIDNVEDAEDVEDMIEDDSYYDVRYFRSDKEEEK
jgi:thiol-disulfide isomerase/thioredoxin